MAKAPPVEEKPDGGAKHLRDKLNAVIGEQVINQLGKPGDLLQVQVRPLWEHNYRVNIFVGTQSAFATIAHSFFVRTDHDGKILVSIPKIVSLQKLTGATAK